MFGVPAHELNSRLKNYYISLSISAAMAFAIGITLWGLIRLCVASIHSSNAAREELLTRDLRDLITSYSADEALALETNVNRLTQTTRRLSPILLPRQKFVLLPRPNSRELPAVLPRNCYLTLEQRPPSSIPAYDGDRICSYIVGESSSERTLFLHLVINENTLVLFERGDPRKIGDALKIHIEQGVNQGTWWLVFQHPRSPAMLNTLEVTAFYETTSGTIQYDRRLLAWGLVDSSRVGIKQLSIYGRLDMRALRPQTAGLGLEDSGWPPKRPETIQLNVWRRDAISASDSAPTNPYLAFGKNIWSLNERARPIVDAQGTLSVKVPSARTPSQELEVGSKNLSLSDGRFPLLLLPNGDLLVDHRVVTKEVALPGTSLTFILRYRGPIFQSVLWRASGLLLFLLAFYVAVSVFVFFKLIRPVWQLSKAARYRLQSIGQEPIVSAPPKKLGLYELIKHAVLDSLNNALTIFLHFLEGKRMAVGERFPYSDKTGEIGLLSRGFNAVVDQISRQARHEEREARSRRNALVLIRHEVGNALNRLYLDKQTTPKQKENLKKIRYFFDSLDNDLGPNGVPMSLERHDIAARLSQAVIELKEDGIELQYFGPSGGVQCLIDEDCFDKSIENIVTNALERKSADTPVEIHLSELDNNAIIRIRNEGSHIPEGKLDEIFEQFVSVGEKSDGKGEGLGLWVSDAYIAKMNGEIRARNTQLGVEFSIRLPIQVATSP